MSHLNCNSRNAWSWAVRLGGFGHFEAIPCSAHGFKIARGLGIDFNFFSDATDVDIDGPGGDEACVTPDGVEEVVSAEDSAGMADQIVEEAELGSGGGDKLSVDTELHGAGVDLDIFKLDDGRSGGTLEATEDGFDAGDEFAGGEGLGDVVVSTEFESLDAVVFGCAGSKEDDGDHTEGGVLAEAAAEVEAITAGDHDVEQEEGGWLAFGIGEDLVDGEIGANGKPCTFQVVLN